MDELQIKLKKFSEEWDEATENQDQQRFFDCAVDLRDYLDKHGFPRKDES